MDVAVRMHTCSIMGLWRAQAARQSLEYNVRMRSHAADRMLIDVSIHTYVHTSRDAYTHTHKHTQE
jgi:hypothetical protein